jgi:hypothetical protein
MNTVKKNLGKKSKKSVKINTGKTIEQAKFEGWIHEDELPKDISKSSYMEWFRGSQIVQDFRMGPPLKPASEEKERCKKVLFINEDFALQYIAKLKATSVRTKIPTRAYLCEKCLNWHLSSKGEYEEPTKTATKIKEPAVKNGAIEQRDNRIKNLEKKLDAAYSQITDLTRINTVLRNSNAELLKTNNTKTE